MWRPSRTKMWNSTYGMLEDRTKFDPSGDITTLAHRDWFLWWIVRTENELTRPNRNYTGYWVIEKWRNACCLSLQTSKICQEVSFVPLLSIICLYRFRCSHVPCRGNREAGPAPNAWSFLVCASQVCLHKNQRGQNIWRCQFSCATTGEGLFEGLQWLSQNVKKRQQ